jgi:hypothetical protein
MSDLFAELKDAVANYDDWPTPEGRARVISLARRFVRAVDQKAAVIEQMRQQVTPTEEALSQLMNDTS